MAVTIDQARLSEVAARGLKAGAHNDFSSGMCAMEAASYIAGEPWSDHPQCVSPVIGAFMRSWNDSLNNEDRNRLITPELIAKCIGTATPALDERRSYMAVDWFVRVHTPAWLKLAGLHDQAALVAGLPEITGFAQIPSIRAPLEAVRKDAAAAGDAAWAAAGDAAWAAARDAARAAARDAARAAAWAAAGDAAWAAARDAARAAAWAAAGDAARDAAMAAAWAAAGDAARDAARAAAWAAAGDAARDAARAAAWAAAGDAAMAAAWAALRPIVSELQLSARDLVERMCALTVEAA